MFCVATIAIIAAYFTLVGFIIYELFYALYKKYKSKVINNELNLLYQTFINYFSNYKDDKVIFNYPLIITSIDYINREINNKYIDKNIIGEYSFLINRNINTSEYEYKKYSEPRPTYYNSDYSSEDEEEDINYMELKGLYNYYDNYKKDYNEYWIYINNCLNLPLESLDNDYYSYIYYTIEILIKILKQINTKEKSNMSDIDLEYINNCFIKLMLNVYKYNIHMTNSGVISEYLDFLSISYKNDHKDLINYDAINKYIDNVIDKKKSCWHVHHLQHIMFYLVSKFDKIVKNEILDNKFVKIQLDKIINHIMFDDVGLDSSLSRSDYNEIYKHYLECIYDNYKIKQQNKDEFNKKLDKSLDEIFKLLSEI